jgi:hypothetical protein
MIRSGGGAEIRPAVFDCAALLRIELREVSDGHRCMRAGSSARGRKNGDSSVRVIPAAPHDSDRTTRTDAERKNKFGRVRAIRDFARA